ncbi:hypothetical protein PENFLA_c011G10792 [Penicillium flavigenum]|uniref:Uncharacterized protein n=1 Tax=Penicillium flavigenum TaxID=254877 RepID=A0A1V6TCM7_9EURO|nr:hypothetical protein PENFLA_c011G10792 [Penicillium flavigenum]
MGENTDSEPNAIHETYEESSTVAGPRSTRTAPFIIFIARSSAAPSHQVKQEWLLEFVHWVEQVHLQEYGSLDSRSVGFIPFFQSSNRQLPTDGEVLTKLSAVFQNARDAGCGVIMVISGWDGLTTHDLSMPKISEEAEGVDVTLRYYVEDLDDGCRYFRDVKLRDAYGVLREEIEATDENPSLQAFAKYYKGIQACNAASGVAKQELNGLSFRRNTFNPDSEKNTKAATTTRKKRGTMVRVQRVEEQPMGSDNGLKPYLSIDPAGFHKAPRIDIKSHCSSKKVTRYTQKSIVRKHDRKEHSIEYKPFSKMLNVFEEQPHIDGLRWIAICMQRGQKQAGAAPVPRRW